MSTESEEEKKVEHLVTLENTNGDIDVFSCESNSKRNASVLAQRYIVKTYGGCRSKPDKDFIIIDNKVNSDSEYNEFKYKKDESGEIL